MFMATSAVLHSEGKSTTPPQEGKSVPNIIQELDALFPAGPSQTSFSYLKSLANKVYLRYMTSKAHYYALGNISRPADICGVPGSPVKPEADSGEAGGWNGDRQMANLTLRMRDCLWYYELCHAVVDGDIGRVMEVLKVTAVVSDSSPSLIYITSSINSHSGVLGHQTMAKS
jgi:hypothetical protein